MRKKIFCGITILAIAAVAAWNVNLNSQPSNKFSDTMLANVEALAEGESGRQCSKIKYYCTCYRNGSWAATSITECESYTCSSIMDQSSCKTTSCPTGSSCN